jgi:hypothetical protein
MASPSAYTDRFAAYFDRPVAQKAAQSLADGVEIEFRVAGSDGSALETFTFTRTGGRNQLVRAGARDPQLVFTLTPAAADQILDDPSEEVGAIGVAIARLIVSADANRRVKLSLKAGFLTLFSKGYLGVVTAGGASFASFLASRGLNGIGGIKSALKNLKGN